MPRITRTDRSLLLTSALMLLTACGAPADDSDTEPRLLYGLSHEDVETIHENYLAGEDFDTTLARVSAPFDCSLFDDLCDQVGAVAAEEITGELVDLALDGAALEDIEGQFDARVDDVAGLEPDVDPTDAFRSSGPWLTSTDGNVRFRARNGITTPLIGMRRAWTEAKAQKRGAFGWSSVTATQICVDAGTNTQVRVTSIFPTIVLESFNPSNACASWAKSSKSQTYHARNSTSASNIYYGVTARGCASAEINGTSFAACPNAHARTY